MVAINPVAALTRAVSRIQVDRAMRKASEVWESVQPGILPPRLFVIELGPGDHGSINVGWFKNGAKQLDPKAWLDQGYDGVVFRGASVEETHVRCTSWDGVTIAVGRHDGIVRFENMTVHAGYDKGAQFGEQNLARILVPGFRIEIENVVGLVDPLETYIERRDVNAQVPAPYSGTLVAQGKPDVLLTRGDQVPHAGTLLGQRRPKWFWFSYNADLVLKNVRTYGAQLAEHNLYAHGFASLGLDINACLFDGSGSQHVKVRSDASETAWAGPKQTIRIRFTTFRDNMRAWSWRGPGMIVCEGTACDIQIFRCLCFGGEPVDGVAINDRSRAIQISSEGNSYAHGTGKVGTGFGNGIVWISECAAYGASDVFWHNEIIRCGRNGGTQRPARAFLMERCGVWGRNLQVQLGPDIPTGRALIRECNTPQIAEICRGLGFKTSPEAVVSTASRLVPISEGIQR